MTSALEERVLPVASRYRLALVGTPARLLAGEVSSRRTGGAVEFEDFRSYVPGDDPRHIDWAAYARTDALVVRLHQAELRLAVDLVVDASRSMGGLSCDSRYDSKAALARELSMLLAASSRRRGAAVRVWLAGDRLERVRGDPAAPLESFVFESRVPLPEALSAAEPFEPGSVRIVLSDFLFPHDPESYVLPLSRGAAGLALVQILAAEERDPTPGGRALLVDVETAESRPLVLDRHATLRYRARLAELVEGLARACRRTRARFARVVDSAGLEGACRDALVPEGVLEPG